MIYKMLPKTDGEKQIFARIDEDEKCRLTCTAQNPEFQNYLKNGGELQDADGNVIDKAYVASLP
jgi:hypothetical protein